MMTTGMITRVIAISKRIIYTIDTMSMITTTITITTKIMTTTMIMIDNATLGQETKMAIPTEMRPTPTTLLETPYFMLRPNHPLPVHATFENFNSYVEKQL
jgi:hypothetical protein